MKRFVWRELSPAERRAALARPARRRDPAVVETVRRIFDEVAEDGEAAVARWSEKLDGAAPRRIDLDRATVDAARARLSVDDLQALALAVDAVRSWHLATRPQDGPEIETLPGVKCTRVWRPITTAGMYVPGGTAPLFSTLLMLALPAQAAGVPEPVAVTPPRPGGGLDPAVAAAAAACGLETVWTVGGAQAIAALAFGAGPPKADKLFGPGNTYVTEAKRLAAELPGGPGSDLPAGPSELLVLADDAADPRLVAADLLSQAEHDADAQVVLVAVGETVAAAVEREIAARLTDLPRAATARAALAEARVIVARSVEEAVTVSDAYAPEHLSVQTRDPARTAALVSAAGAVFVGPGSAETFGDYLAGPSHVLPTDGAARAWSGVTTAAFMTSMSVQTISPEAAARLAAPAARLARLEGLEAHARAAEIRAEVRS